MKKCLLLGIFAFIITFGLDAQGIKNFKEARSGFRPSYTKINDLVHTKLDLRFDYDKQYVYGKAWITLKPHFYPTDSLRLDAKGMDLKKVLLMKKGKSIPLKFSYDSLTMLIKLDKSYAASETYTIYINYTGKPNNLKVRNEGHGLYFINPIGKEKEKPTQIWTNGEPECNSAWFPTIDRPNQKTTEEIILTVPAKYVTLSNGRLVSQTKNTGGTRTDTWKMDLPHAPYLFMIAVGDFAIVKDNWRGKDVSYYLEPKYAGNARAIFANIPEAMTFFSKILGVDYPWNKYAEIRVHGFNGGMENTTATEFNEDGQSSPRELADRGYESGNVHELFHQWFGDYVTSESWSNLPLNESFADLGEILWAEYKYGQDVADEHLYRGQQSYLDNSEAARENLIRFNYIKEQDMFDVVTYQKGGRILNMLRHYLGNTAFYKGLHIYLTNHAFQSVEGQDLRLSMEEASGLDLNWFFNQWFYGSGHPVLRISYHWNEAKRLQNVYIEQTQEGEPFVLPIAVDLYKGNKKQRYQIWIRNKTDTLTFPADMKPDMVNVDAEKILLAKKIDSKTLSEFAFQYGHVPLYLDRLEAIDAAAGNQQDTVAQKILIAALHDRYYGLRIKALQALDLSNVAMRKLATSMLVELARHEPNNQARAEAITQLAKLKQPDDIALFKTALNSRSYLVQGAGLNAIQSLDPVSALTHAKTYENDSKGEVRNAIITIYCQSGGDQEWPYVYHCFADPASPLQYTFTGRFADLTARVANPVYARQGIEAIANLVIELKRFNILPRIIEILEQIKDKRLALNDWQGSQAADEAIRRMKTAQQIN